MEYIIEYKLTSDKDYVTAGRVDAALDKYSVRGLTEGKEYMIRVKARNAAGSSKAGAELPNPQVAKLPYGKQWFMTWVIE